MEDKKKKINTGGFIYFALGASIALCRSIGRRNPEWEFELSMLAVVLVGVLIFLIYRANKRIDNEEGAD